MSMWEEPNNPVTQRPVTPCVQGFFLGLASGLFSAVALPVAGCAVGAACRKCCLSVSLLAVPQPTVLASYHPSWVWLSTIAQEPCVGTRGHWAQAAEPPRAQWEAQAVARP